MRRLCWFIWVSLSKCHHKEGGRERIDPDRKGGGDMTTEAETTVISPQAKECRQPLEAGRSKE